MLWDPDNYRHSVLRKRGWQEERSTNRIREEGQLVGEGRKQDRRGPGEFVAPLLAGFFFVPEKRKNSGIFRVVDAL
jgi:hypothetical protein